MATALPIGITWIKDRGGRAALLLVGAAGEVGVSLCGAQVLWWRNHLGEVLWSATNSEYLTGKPVRGGIPLVFPWFGDHAADPKLPAHGFARNLEWRLARAVAGPEVVLEVTDDVSTRSMWPHSFRLQLVIAVAEALRIELTIQNTDTRSMRCEEALHTYLSVGDVHSCSVHGLEGLPVTEQATAPETAWDRSAPLRFRAETDRVFQGVRGHLELRAPALQRRVELDTEGANSTIVWNPWHAKTARLSQMAADDWQRFCCIESANVRERSLTLAAGQQHTLALTIRCR